MSVVSVLGLSIVIQFAAAFFALRLAAVTRKYTAWILIVAALFAMGVEHCITLSNLISAGFPELGSLSTALVALVISALTLAGVFYITPLFIAIKRSEAMLRESEERYRDLFDNTHDIIHSVAPDGHLIFANQAWLDTLGYNEAELTGLNLFEIIHPESMSHCQETFSRIMAGEAVRDIQITFMTKDGRPIPVEGSGTACYINGKVDEIQCILHEVTQSKEAWNALWMSEQNYRNTIAANPDAVIIVDKNGIMHFANPAAEGLFGNKPGGLVGELFGFPLVSGEKTEIDIMQRDGQMSVAEMSIVEVWWKRESAYLAVLRDVTERKKIEEQLLVTDRLSSIGELAAGVAHELNNPLTSVIGFSLLLLDKRVPDDVKEKLNIINNEAQRMARIVKNLLSFARQHALVKKLVNIHSIVEKVLELRAYEQKVNNIQINTQFASDVPEIMADFFQLQQVFMNIIINAEYFMIQAHKKGTITIITEREGDTVRLSFADDGPGIAKENIGRIFAPFFTTKEMDKGTGLGLSICHGIIVEHGGRIYAESELGKGATFVVELPVDNHRQGEEE